MKSFLTGFPYSTWGFYLSDDATKLYYLRNDEPSPLVMLDLTKSTDISQGDVISSDDWSKKNFWSPSWNEKDGFLYWMGDQRNDEKIDLYRMDPKTGETTCFRGRPPASPTSRTSTAGVSTTPRTRPSTWPASTR